MTATVPPLNQQEMEYMLDLFERCMLVILQPMDQAEAASYVRKPSNTVEIHNYTEFVVRRMIRSFKHLYEFRTLQLRDQITILKVLILMISYIYLQFASDSMIRLQLHPHYKFFRNKQ